MIVKVYAIHIEHYGDLGIDFFGFATDETIGKMKQKAADYVTGFIYEEHNTRVENNVIYDVDANDNAIAGIVVNKGNIKV